MKINWKARFKNKVFVISLCTLIISFGYQILALCDIFPAITEGSAMNLVNVLVNFVSVCGVVTDPTTEGFHDSDRAMTYYTKDDVRDAEEEPETTEIEG